jgi:GNAT superfamily N-acetyltransferase
MMDLVPAQSHDDLLAARQLFMEYADWLGVDLCFQGFQQELDGLPGDYAPPDGQLLLAVEDDQAVGCAAMRKLGDGICEMKRLYVRPGHRSKGLGRKLVEAIIQEARGTGYEKMRLDSLTSLKEAAGLYRSLGFTEIPPYRYNPLPDAVFMDLGL